MLVVSLLPLSLAALVSARIHHSRVPEDPYAFPKYRVSFLNGLPVLNETAERWLHDGLHGGELEFLDQPWRESHWDANPLRRIEGTDDRQDAVCPHVHATHVHRELMASLRSGSLVTRLQLHAPANEARTQVLVPLSHPPTASRPSRGRGAPSRSIHARTQLVASAAPVWNLPLRKSRRE